MTPAELPDSVLDHLRRLGDELRAVFTAERAAIAKLDHEALALLADRKRDLSDELARVAPRAPRSPDVRALFQAIHVEAQANALLARAATEAVHALLGIDPRPAGYDRRAHQTTTGRASRLLAAY